MRGIEKEYNGTREKSKREKGKKKGQRESEGIIMCKGNVKGVCMCLWGGE